MRFELNTLVWISHQDCILIAQRHKPVVVARNQAEVELAVLSIKEGVA